MALAWDNPIEGEGTLPFAAFARYRDLGPERSIDKAYRAARAGGRAAAASGGKRVSGRAPGTWNGWSKQFHWPERAAACDADESRKRAEIRQREVGEALRLLEKRRAQYETEQYERLLLIEQDIYTALRKIASQGSHLMLDPGYRGMVVALLKLGREIVIGPRGKQKPEDAPPPEEKLDLDRLSELSDEEVNQAVAISRRLRQLLATPQ